MKAIKIKYDLSRAKPVSSVEFPSGFDLSEKGDYFFIFNRELLFPLMRRKYILKKDFLRRLDLEKKTVAGRLVGLSKDPDSAEEPLNNQESFLPILVIDEIGYVLNSDVDELELFELNPEWPPDGYREDPENPGQLLPVEPEKKSVLGKLAEKFKG